MCKVHWWNCFAHLVLHSPAAVESQLLEGSTVKPPFLGRAESKVARECVYCTGAELRSAASDTSSHGVNPDVPKPVSHFGLQHLVSRTSEDCTPNLTHRNYGVITAFSTNSVHKRWTQRICEFANSTYASRLGADLPTWKAEVCRVVTKYNKYTSFIHFNSWVAAALPDQVQIKSALKLEAERTIWNSNANLVMTSIRTWTQKFRTC